MERAHADATSRAIATRMRESMLHPLGECARVIIAAATRDDLRDANRLCTRFNFSRDDGTADSERASRVCAHCPADAFCVKSSHVVNNKKKKNISKEKVVLDSITVLNYISKPSQHQ